MPVPVPRGDRDALADLAEAVRRMHPDRRARYLASLDDEDFGIVEEAMTREQVDSWRSTPDAMALHLWGPRRFARYRYVRFLGEQFRKLVTGEEPRQIWNLPARYGKSTIGSQWGPAWLLDLRPWTTSMLVSYGDDLANENAVKVRDILREYHGQIRTQLRQDRRRMDRFVTDEGGGITAGGIGSALTGFGVSEGGALVVDDPFKNWTEAHQPGMSDKVWNNYRSVLRIRLDSDDAGILVIQTRWHENDLTGRLLKASEDELGDSFKLIRLPALAEAANPQSSDPALWLPDPLGREIGEPLCVERFPVDSVKARARALGTYLTAALEQQRPAPEEGGEIKRAWFKIEPTYPVEGDEWLSSWDMKLKDTSSGSYVVGSVWVRTGTAKWLLDVFRGQWNMATTENAIALACVRWPKLSAHLIENTGNGPEVMAELRKAHPGYEVSDEIAGTLGMTEAERAAVNDIRQRGQGGLLPITPKGSKVVRVRAVSGSIEAGDVHIWERAHFLGAFLDEIASFPNEPNDQADSMSQALARLNKGIGSISTPARTNPAPAALPRRVRRYDGRRTG